MSAVETQDFVSKYIKYANVSRVTAVKAARITKRVHKLQWHENGHVRRILFKGVQAQTNEASTSSTGEVAEGSRRDGFKSRWEKTIEWRRRGA